MCKSETTYGTILSMSQIKINLYNTHALKTVGQLHLRNKLNKDDLQADKRKTEIACLVDKLNFVAPEQDRCIQFTVR